MLDNMPRDLLRHAIPPCCSSPADTAEDSSVNDRSSQQPFIHRSFHPVRNGHGPDMPALSNKIHNRPMIFPTLQVVDVQFREFAPPKATSQQDGEKRPITFTLG